MRNKAPSTFRMRFGVGFRLPRPRQYDVAPRYYDEDKERRDARYEEYRAEFGGAESEEHVRRKISFREQVDEKWARSSFSRQHLYSNLRLMLILVLLCCGFYIAYDYLANF